ncbi:unnamed protein product, partial [Callosobruchus maculatus]
CTCDLYHPTRQGPPKYKPQIASQIILRNLFNFARKNCPSQKSPCTPNQHFIGSLDGDGASEKCATLANLCPDNNTPG